MCTIKSPNLLCTYVHIKPKLILFNTVAPPASCTNINSLSTKPMFQTFHLEPINDVLCKELGLWGDWSGLLHLPNYCAHMCTIIFHRGLSTYTNLVVRKGSNRLTHDWRPLLSREYIYDSKRLKWLWYIPPILCLLGSTNCYIKLPRGYLLFKLSFRPQR